MQQLTKNIQNSLNQDYTEYLNNIEDEVNMDQFYINLQELKDDTIEEQPAFNQLRRKNQKSKENCFLQTTQKKVFRNLTPEKSQEKIVYRISTPKNDYLKQEKQLLSRKLKTVNSELKKQLQKSAQKKQAKSKSKIRSDIYERSQHYISRSKQKIQEIKQQQKLEDTKELTFNPKTNNSQKSKLKKSSISFIEKVQKKEQLKKQKIQQQRNDINKQREENLFQECSFKPKLKLNTKIKRSLSNLFEWKNQQEIKKAELQQNFYNKQKSEKKSEKSKLTLKKIGSDTKNKIKGGQRLYDQHINKQKQKKELQQKRVSERIIRNKEARKKSYSKSFKVINLDPQQPNYLQKNKQMIQTIKKKKQAKSKSKKEKTKLNYNNFKDLKNFFQIIFHTFIQLFLVNRLKISLKFINNLSKNIPNF